MLHFGTYDAGLDRIALTCYKLLLAWENKDMRVFQRDNKFYVGPVNDQEIDAILSRRDFSSMAGIACRADGRQVDTYITLPVDKVARTDLAILGMQGASQ